MITREAFTVTELVRRSTAVLTAVSVPREQKRVGDLATELARNVNKPDQSNDARPRKNEMFAAENPIPVHLDDLGFAIDDKPQRPPDRNEGQRLERRVQRQATCVQPHMTQNPAACPNPAGGNGFVGILPSAVSSCKTVAFVNAIRLLLYDRPC